MINFATCLSLEVDSLLVIVAPLLYVISNDKTKKYFNTQQNPNEDPNKRFKLTIHVHS